MLPSQDPVQLQMDRLPDLRTVTWTWTVQAGRNAARASAVILQVSMNELLIRRKADALVKWLGLYVFEDHILNQRVLVLLHN